MTKDLGRISQLKKSIDSLYTWYQAVNIINSETGIQVEDEPRKAYEAAKLKLAELEKQ